MKVGDVMTTDVVAVRPEASVQEIAQTLLEHRISAVFVVDSEGHPIGVASEGDLIQRAETDTVRSRSCWLRSLRLIPGNIPKRKHMAGHRAASTPTTFSSPSSTWRVVPGSRMPR